MGTTASLSPETWADAALAVIAEAGVEALHVESLARRLEVTKGSFYWHFSSRAALLLVALARWERLEWEVLQQDLESIAEPRARLRRLLWRGRDPLLERLLSSVDPNVRRALARVRDRRLDLLSGAYRELGLEEPGARARALLAYAAYVGFTQLEVDDAVMATELLLPEA